MKECEVQRIRLDDSLAMGLISSLNQVFQSNSLQFDLWIAALLALSNASHDKRAMQTVRPEPMSSTHPKLLKLPCPVNVLCVANQMSCLCSVVAVHNVFPDIRSVFGNMTTSTDSNQLSKPNVRLHYSRKAETRSPLACAATTHRCCSQ